MTGDGIFGLRRLLCVAAAFVIAHETTESDGNAKTPPQSQYWPFFLCRDYTLCYKGFGFNQQR